MRNHSKHLCPVAFACVKREAVLNLGYWNILPEDPQCCYVDLSILLGSIAHAIFMIMVLHILCAVFQCFKLTNDRQNVGDQ